jgi:two-component system cell cycle sensor histidine kinase/response regulator CckA
MPPAYGTPTALLIEDEPTVRTIARRALEPDICAVVEAENGEQGLRLLEQHSQSIDLVIVDLVLPGINGLELIETIISNRPGLPLLCITGFGRTAIDMLEPMIRDYHVPVLTKPFTATALATAVSDLLDRAQRRKPQTTR